MIEGSEADERFESLENAENEFNEATRCVIESLQGIHERLGRIEKWIKNQPKMNRI